MHKVMAKGILSTKNGMNIYRGCTHGCIYCDSRSTCYHMNHEFEDVEVKENGPELLIKALSSKRKKTMIGTGSMTDPYIPLEKELGYMRKCLEIIYDYGFGVSIITKSDLILRDIDLIEKINNKAKAVVSMTLTTADEELCKKLEPGVATTKERFEVLMEFKKKGIPTVVWLSPFLPYINDTKENIKSLLEYCVEAEVKGIICFGIGLTLRDGNREYFYKQLDRLFPGMKERYVREFGYSYQVGSRNNNALMTLIRKTCCDNNIMCRPDEVFQYMSNFDVKDDSQQLSLEGLGLI